MIKNLVMLCLTFSFSVMARAGCPYFTLPPVQHCDDAVIHNYWTEGAKLCFKGEAYVCTSGGVWDKRGGCDFYKYRDASSAEARDWGCDSSPDQDNDERSESNSKVVTDASGNTANNSDPYSIEFVNDFDQQVSDKDRQRNANRVIENSDTESQIMNQQRVELEHTRLQQQQRETQMYQQMIINHQNTFGAPASQQTDSSAGSNAAERKYQCKLNCYDKYITGCTAQKNCNKEADRWLSQCYTRC